MVLTPGVSAHGAGTDRSPITRREPIVIRELHAVTVAALARLPVGEAAAALLARVRAILRVDVAAVLLLSEDLHHLVVLAAEGDLRGLASDARIALSEELGDQAVAVEIDPGKGGAIETPLQTIGIRSVLRVPLLVEGRVTGVVEVGTVEPCRFSSKDARLLQLAADRMALAIDYRRLQEAERQAAERAGRLERRLAFLIEVSRVLHTTRDVASSLVSVSRRAVLAFADWCAVDLVTAGGATARAAMAHRDPGRLSLARELDQRYPTDVRTPHGVAHVLRTGRAEFVRVVSIDTWQQQARDEEHLRLLHALDLRSTIATPIVARRRVLGAISFARAGGGTPYDHADVAIAEQVAQCVAVAFALAGTTSEIPATPIDPLPGVEG